MTDDRQLQVAKELESAEVYDGDWHFRLFAWINDGGLAALIRLAEQAQTKKQAIEKVARAMARRNGYPNATDLHPYMDAATEYVELVMS